eukprot:TRINITY_DN47283_c0_g1_i1.p1 TRINITY_DN47283_c0_g1~~TRINITY_DN47283_c0_g1_i1.p1  ORF type:complete len:624 (+),score=188.62 TRINITY_DN47283_c0_g1_i1:153-1874(+)
MAAAAADAPLTDGPVGPTRCRSPRRLMIRRSPSCAQLGKRKPVLSQLLQHRRRACTPQPHDDGSDTDDAGSHDALAWTAGCGSPGSTASPAPVRDLSRVYPLQRRLRSSDKDPAQAMRCMAAMQSIARLRDLPGIGRQAARLNRRIRRHLHRTADMAAVIGGVDPSSSDASGSDSTIPSPLPRPSSTLSPLLDGWVKGRLLGRGSSGAVYEAVAGGRVYAAKEIPLQPGAVGKPAAAICAEVEMLSGLHHPHIVGYMGTHLTADRLYIFMEYMPGGSVGSLARRSGGLDFAAVQRFSHQILKGLTYLHSMTPPVVHRDLKGDNILHDTKGTVKLADFGAARRAAVLLQPQQSGLQGTIPYLAPEVIETWGPEAYKPAADIWSFGCVVLEMATGAYPWGWGQGSMVDPVQALYRITHDLAGPPRPTGMPPEMADMVGTCLSRDPKERPTAAQLLRHPFITQHLRTDRGAQSLRGSGSSGQTADSFNDVVTLRTETDLRSSLVSHTESCSIAASFAETPPPSPPPMPPTAPPRSRFVGRAAAAARALKFTRASPPSSDSDQVPSPPSSSPPPDQR